MSTTTQTITITIGANTVANGQYPVRITAGARTMPAPYAASQDDAIAWANKYAADMGAKYNCPATLAWSGKDYEGNLIGSFTITK